MSGDAVRINEVAPRDGLQNEERYVATADKIALVDRLARTGVAKIEVTSFVSPKAIPALADAAEVMRGLTRAPGVTYAALVANARGAARAIAAGVDELNLVMSASEGHSRANLRMSPADSLSMFAEIIDVARAAGVATHASISTSFGCPFDGEVPPARVLGIVDRLAGLGLRGVTLCDTTGMANPAQVAQLATEAVGSWAAVELTAHFHDTRGMGLANVVAALGAGVRSFDASLGGLGGCPFAPGASGNVCTEDVVHMLEAMGFRTGVDLDALIAAARDLPRLLGHDVRGQVTKAGPATRRYALDGTAR
jgi:hydroxymethylglutaryl-CoA lyase